MLIAFQETQRPWWHVVTSMGLHPLYLRDASIHFTKKDVQSHAGHPDHYLSVSVMQVNNHRIELKSNHAYSKKMVSKVPLRVDVLLSNFDDQWLSKWQILATDCRLLNDRRIQIHDQDPVWGRFYPYIRAATTVLPLDYIISSHYLPDSAPSNDIMTFDAKAIENIDKRQWESSSPS